MRRLALLATLVLSSCTSINKGVNQGTEVLSEAILPTSQEVILGNELAAEVEAKERILQNQAVQDYVSRVGQLLVQATNNARPGITYSFKVIDEATVNAFALPGGHIYVYTGLIKMVGSEAELAAVLGHEVGHVVGRHAAQSLVQQLGVQTVTAMVLGQDPNMVAQIGSAVAAQGYMMKNSRDHEREADELGLSFMVRTGYAPSAMPSMFDKLAKLGGTNPNIIEAFLASHPDPEQRAKTARARITSSNLLPGSETIVGDIRPIQAQLGGAADSAAPVAPPPPPKPR